MLKLELSSVVSEIPNDTNTYVLHKAESDWLFNTQSRVLQLHADWLIWENNEMATLDIVAPCT